MEEVLLKRKQRYPFLTKAEQQFMNDKQKREEKLRKQGVNRANAIVSSWLAKEHNLPEAKAYREKKQKNDFISSEYAPK